MVLSNIVQKNDYLVSMLNAGLSSVEQVSRDNRIYASSAYCERKNAIEGNRVGENFIPPKTQAYFGLGVAIEDIILKALYKKNVLLFSGYKIPEIGINLGGKVDGIYVDENDNFTILEVKTCSTIPKTPQSYYVGQARAYSAVLGLPASLLYFSRNVSSNNISISAKSFDLGYNETENIAILTKLVRAFVYGKNGVFPPMPKNQRKVDCGFCDLTGFCFDNKELPFTTILQPSMYVEELEREVLGTVISIFNETENRRNGCIKHIVKSGTIKAASYANSDWSKHIPKIGT